MSKKSAGLIMAGVLLLGAQAWAAQAEGQASKSSSTPAAKQTKHTKHTKHTHPTKKTGETKPMESATPGQ